MYFTFAVAAETDNLTSHIREEEEKERKRKRNKKRKRKKEEGEGRRKREKEEGERGGFERCRDSPAKIGVYLR
jgi:hypothetical protein